MIKWFKNIASIPTLLSRIIDLENRIKVLEQRLKEDVNFKVYKNDYFTNCFFTKTENIHIKEVIKKLLFHCELELKYTMGTPETIIMVKKEKRNENKKRSCR